MTRNVKKVLFIGLGAIGQRHLRNLMALKGADVEILAYRVRNLPHTISPELTILDDNLTGRYPIKVFKDLSLALNQQPTAVFICNPTSLHIPPAIEAAKAGCHIFMEKPLSHSLEGIEELSAICKQKKLIFFVGYQLRFHPCYKLLKSLIQEKKAGALLSVRVEIGEYLPGTHKYEDYRQMYAAREDLGGGAVLSLIHEIDYLYDLFNMPTKVFAMGGKLSSLQVDTEDCVEALLEMNYQNKYLPVSLHMDFFQRPAVRRCVVIGEEGRITMDLAGLEVKIEKPDAKNNETHHFKDFQRNDLFVEELKSFLQCVEENTRPPVTLEEGLKSLRIALSIKQSLTTGKVVDLSENKHVSLV